MEHDLDTNQGDGNLESPFPSLRHLTLALYYIPYTRATTAWGKTHSILPTAPAAPVSAFTERR
jgi:hypothetical protein